MLAVVAGRQQTQVAWLAPQGLEAVALGVAQVQQELMALLTRVAAGAAQALMDLLHISVAQAAPALLSSSTPSLRQMYSRLNPRRNGSPLLVQ